jgi:hypothetical protein
MGAAALLGRYLLIVLIADHGLFGGSHVDRAVEVAARWLVRLLVAAGSVDCLTGMAFFCDGINTIH